VVVIVYQKDCPSAKKGYKKSRVLVGSSDTGVIYEKRITSEPCGLESLVMVGVIAKEEAPTDRVDWPSESD
jgi:hypothetical protein